MAAFAGPLVRIQSPPAESLSLAPNRSRTWRTPAFRAGDSARRSKSPSVIIPTSCPFLSRTGIPLMRRLIMSLATSSTVVSGVVVATALYMTSLALIGPSSSCTGETALADETAVDVDQRDQVNATGSVRARPRLNVARLPAGYWLWAAKAKAGSSSGLEPR